MSLSSDCSISVDPFEVLVITRPLRSVTLFRHCVSCFVVWLVLLYGSCLIFVSIRYLFVISFYLCVICLLFVCYLFVVCGDFVYDPGNPLSAGRHSCNLIIKSAASSTSAAGARA